MTLYDYLHLLEWLCLTCNDFVWLTSLVRKTLCDYFTHWMSKSGQTKSFHLLESLSMTTVKSLLTSEGSHTKSFYQVKVIKQSHSKKWR